jgi:hypothetical protein
MPAIQLQPSGLYEWPADQRLKMPRCVGIDSRRLAECVARYNEGGLGGLFGNPYFGFQEKDLNFLAQTQQKPVYLWFWDVDLQDVEALYEVEELDNFGIHPKRPGIDFSRFRRMTRCTHHWLKSDRGLTNAPIADYMLWHFKPRSQSFAGLEVPLGATRLELTWANPASLRGLPVLKHLKELQIHRCRNLADLSALPEIAPNLRHLLTTTSSRLDLTAGVLDHPTLRTARIDGREMIE